MSDLKDFFISYNKADREWAEWIAWQLEEAGYTTVIQAWDFRPGSNWVLEMDHGLSVASRVIAVVSQSFLDSQYTRPEWAAAFAKDPMGSQRRLVQVRVRHCKVQGLLLQIVRIELVGLDEEAARQALLEGIKEGRGKPTAPPTFPLAAAAVSTLTPPFPSNLPPIWNVPHHQNRNFTGREDFLKTLQRIMKRKSPTPRVAAISGLGGKGKTQLALEYVYRHVKDYSLIWWLRAQEPATLAMDYAALAPELGVPTSLQSDPRESIPAVRRALAGKDGWLLVFDNAEIPDAIMDYVPQGNGSVIVTSRFDNWRAFAEPVPITDWEPGEAVDFLIKRTGRTDHGAVEHLVEELGFLPLALEQAGAYIEATGCSFEEYLELFRVHKQALLERGRPATDYPDTVATTWNISFEKLTESSPLASDLMNICAFLAPDDIPFDIFQDAAKKLPEHMQEMVKDSLAFKDALAALRCYSLAEICQDALSVHRLVQMVSRDRMSAGIKRKWVGVAVEVLDGVYVFKPDDYKTWGRASRLLPHVLTAGKNHSIDYELEYAPVRLWQGLVAHLLILARFEEAKQLCDKAVPLIEQSFGPDHHYLGEWLVSLGCVHLVQGDLFAAQRIFCRALQILQVNHGQDHPTVAMCLNNLALIFLGLGEPDRAKAEIKKAIAISKRLYGPRHPEVISSQVNLCNILCELRDWSEARILAEQTLAVARADLEETDPSVSACLNVLGLELRARRCPKEAKMYFEEALSIDEQAFGPDHPHVAAVLTNLCLVLSDLRDFEQARDAGERALRIDEATYGTEHMDVARDLSNLGHMSQSSGDLKGARVYFKRALTTYRKLFGDDHPHVRKVLTKLKAIDSTDQKHIIIHEKRAHLCVGWRERHDISEGTTGNRSTVPSPRRGRGTG